MLQLALSAGLLSAALASAATADTWTPPANLHYSKEGSFRGLTPDGKVSGFDVSGHAVALPGVHDFLRLVPEPIKSKDWVAEVAFRLHGPPTAGVTEMSEDGKVRKLHKGGRGLAFWYTKDGLPGPVTISNSKTKLSPPPPSLHEMDSKSDSSVSLFGSRTSFDGLGVIFDTSPNAPLWKRSDKRNTAGDQPWGVGTSGVVSGIMDDGNGAWLDRDDRVMKSEEEASYLEKAIGECEAAFRNAQGLLWARISHVSNTIRVDLGRDYAHNCFTLDGVSLSPGSYVGVSGLASGNTEPDTIDVYAMDVFEVLEEGDPAAVAGTDEPPEQVQSEPLEGTSDDAIPTLTHEIFLSQARMMEAIDALARKVESLSHLVSQSARSGGSAPAPPPVAGAPIIPEERVAAIERHLQDLVFMASTNADANKRGDETESLTHLLQLQDRLMVELKAFGRKLDTSSGASSASLSTLSSRSAESLQILKQAAADLEKAASTPWAKWLWALGGIVFGSLVMQWRQGRRDSDPWSTSRKMI
ncbi:SPOSA6832_01012, partial [Sporobolomyces salmonicolor]